METENRYASKGVGGTALGLSIGALGVEALRGGLGGILGGVGNGGCGCNEDHTVNRYEAMQSAKISELETEIKLRDANAFTMGELNKFRNYVDGKFSTIEGQICQQAVTNAQIAANISCMQSSIAVLNGLTKTIIPITNICPEPAVATPTTGA
jgi:hypothetical protein